MDSASNTVSELLEISAGGRDSAATNATFEDGNGGQWSNPFISNITPEPQKEEIIGPIESPETTPVPQLITNDQDVSSNDQQQLKSGEPGAGDATNDDDNMEAQKPNKILTEVEAKAALAEKRRLAREAVEKEAARIAEVECLVTLLQGYFKTLFNIL